MKSKILTFLFLIPIIGFASFPVFENYQENKSETVTLNSNNTHKKNSLNIYAKISLASFALTVIFIYVIAGGIGSLMMSGQAIANYISYSILSFLSGIIFGIISLVKRNKERYY